MKKKHAPTRRLGSLPHVETEAFRQLFKEAGLSRADFAALAGASVRRMAKGGYSSGTVDCWLSGTRYMSADTYQLFRARLSLLKRQLATFHELVNQPLEDIVDNIVTKLVQQRDASKLTEPMPSSPDR